MITAELSQRQKPKVSCHVELEGTMVARLGEELIRCTHLFPGPKVQLLSFSHCDLMVENMIIFYLKRFSYCGFIFNFFYSKSRNSFMTNK